MTPNKQGSVFLGRQLPPDHTIIGTSSYHPGGVNVGFLDGSVKFVKDSVDQMTWWAISTMNGGEVVKSADKFLTFVKEGGGVMPGHRGRGRFLARLHPQWVCREPSSSKILRTSGASVSSTSAETRMCPASTPVAK